MTDIPAAAYFTDSARTNGEAKQAQDDILAVLRELLGGSAESELTIASGSITPMAGVHSVDTEGDAASDDLTTIVTTNVPDGRFLLIRCASASRALVVKHNAGGAGQIALAGGADLPLAATGAWLLLKRTGTDWEEVMRARGVGRVQAKTANYTVTNADFGSLIDCTSGSFTLALTAAAALGDGFWFEAKNSGSGTITIDPNSTELIDGGNTLDIPPGDSCKVWCNGSAFKTVGLVSSEGSWTPSLAGGTVAGSHTYATRVGRYTRVGKLVTAWFGIALSAKDAAMSGGVSIAGLPFAAANIAGLRFSGAVSFFTNLDLSAGRTQVGVALTATASSLSLFQSGDNIGTLGFLEGAVTNTTEIHGSITYRID